MASADGPMSLLGRRFDFIESVSFESNNVALREEDRNGLFTYLAVLNLEEADEETRFFDVQENKNGNLSNSMVSWLYNFSSDTDHSSPLLFSRTSISTLDFDGHDFGTFHRDFKLKNVKHSLLNLSDEKSGYASGDSRYDFDFPCPFYQNFERHNDESDLAPDGNRFYDLDSHFSSPYLDFELKNIKLSLLDLNCEDSYFASNENGFDSDFPSPSCRNFEIHKDEFNFAWGGDGFNDFLDSSGLDFELKNINLSLLDLNCEDSYFASDENGFDSDFPSPSYRNFDIRNDESDFAPDGDGFDDFQGPSYLYFELENNNLSLLNLNVSDSVFASDLNEFDDFDSDFPSPSYRLCEMKCIKVESDYASSENGFGDLDTDFPSSSYLDFELKNIKLSLLDLNGKDSDFTSGDNEFDDSDFPSPSYRKNTKMKNGKLLVVDRRNDESDFAPDGTGFNGLYFDFALDFELNNISLSLLDLNGDDSDFASGENRFDSDFPSPSYRDFELKNINFSLFGLSDEDVDFTTGYCLYDFDSDFPSPTYREAFLEKKSTNEEFIILDDSDNEVLFWPFDDDFYSIFELDTFCEDLCQQNLKRKPSPLKFKNLRAQKSHDQQKLKKRKEFKKGISRKNTTDREEKTVKKRSKGTKNRLSKKEHPTVKAMKEYMKGEEQV